MKKIPLVLSLAVLALSAGCVSTSIKDRKVLTEALPSDSRALRAPLSYGIKMSVDTDWDVPQMLGKDLEKAFKKQKIALAKDSPSHVDIEIVHVRGLHKMARFVTGVFGGSDKIGAIIRWSDGSSIEMTGASGLTCYTPVPTSNFDDAVGELAIAIAKETKKRLKTK